MDGRRALRFRDFVSFEEEWHAPSLEQLNAMPFLISRECCAGEPATFRLAGRLDGDAIEVLVDTCVDIAVGAIIDLAEVSYADDAGVKALGGLAGTGRGAARLEAIPRADTAAGGLTWNLRPQ